MYMCHYCSFYVHNPRSRRAQKKSKKQQLQISTFFYLLSIKCILFKILSTLIVVGLVKGFTSRGYDSVIRRMKSLVCSGIDSMCVFSTFALELEDK